MAVVVFDPAAFKLAFPAFADVPDARLTILFGMVTTTILDNTDASIVTDIDTRTSMLYLLLAHVLTLFGDGVTSGGVGTGPGTAPVGRLASATEGTVSTSFAFDVPASPGSAWFNQTQYGAMYWMMMAPYRSFRYVALGQSGVGRSLDYLRGDRLRRGFIGPNSGTPNGV